MQTLDKDRAVVLFSGGQDSSIALAWALEKYSHVETIGFDYGQRHAVELGARASVRRELKNKFPQWADRLGQDMITPLSGLGAISETALTREQEIKMLDNGLPSTFVPGRNLIFLVLAGAYAYRSGIATIVAGMCEADYSGYPDCRDEALQAQLAAMKLGLDAEFDLQTPLMNIDKAASWALAEKLGGQALIEVINEHSHTCYMGDRSKRHDWGYGCGACPACELREKGWHAYQQKREAD